VTDLLLQLDRSLGLIQDPDRDWSHLSAMAGLVVAGDRLTPGQCRSLPVPVVALIGAAEEMAAWRGEQQPVRVVDDGLEACARLRDGSPELGWVARLVVYKQDVIYRMSDSPGEGFRFYAPDTAAIQGYQIGGGREPLNQVLEQARGLGLSRIWLHAWDAEQRGDGLDLELLERAKSHFGDGLWLSGGATKVDHLANLAREGGASGVVIDDTLLAKVDDGEALVSALVPISSRTQLPPKDVPVDFGSSGRRCPG